MLLTLLTAGSLSDYIGRRPLLFAALLLEGVVMLVLVTASGPVELIAGRFLQGVATGAAAGAVGAALVDLDPARGATVNSVGPVAGTAIGPLAGGAIAQLLPDPTQLVYVVLLAVLAVQAALLLLTVETARRRSGALASLRPTIALPLRTRRLLLVALPAPIATWSLAGFYASLGPTLLEHLLDSRSTLVGGLALGILGALGAAAVLAVRPLPAWTVTLIGATSMLVGLAVTELALMAAPPALFFAGTVIAGIGFGSAFQGAVRSIVDVTGPLERAGVLSLVWVVGYLALGVPAVLAGAVVASGTSVLVTARVYALAVMVLVLATLVEVLLRRLRTRLPAVHEVERRRSA